MSKLKIYEDSKNYTCQVIKLPAIQEVKGLDNLVSVNVQGNQCLIGKDSNPDELYLFFPAECKLSHEFLSSNNLYRHSELNIDKSQKGFFEDNGRVKAVKFKGIISTGFVIPVSSILYKDILGEIQDEDLKLGDEFNEVNGVKICEKYVKPRSKEQGMSNPRTSKIEGIIDHKFAPQHFDTSHLMKNIHKLTLDTYISVTYKLHGTSARYFHTLVKRKLSLLERISKFFGGNVLTEEYNYVVGSRKCLKSVGFEELPGKNHYYTEGDLWSQVGKEYFEGKLNQGEAIYAEIIGSTYNGSPIQGGYTYGLDKPKVFIYRISNINSQGIEVDLSYHQMIERANQLGVSVVPELFYGTVRKFISIYFPDEVDENIPDDFEAHISACFYDGLLEKPSILDNSVIEEGFVLRICSYPKPECFKIKSKLFLLHEGKQLDKADSVDMEETGENITN